MNKENIFPGCGEIWLLKNLEKIKELSKDYRSVLVISSNERNEHDDCVVVLPLTTEDLTDILPVEVLIDNTIETDLKEVSKILCDSPFTFNKYLHFKEKLGIISPESMELIKVAWNVAFFNH